MVEVLDRHRERTAERLAPAQPAGEADLVPLELHPPAAAVPVLAPREVGVDRGDVEPQAGREPFEDRRQERPVRFAGGQEAEA